MAETLKEFILLTSCRCGCENPRTGLLCRSDQLYTVSPSGIHWAIIVVDIKKITEQRDGRPADRRDAYTPPKLKEFGPVGALTQSGSGGGSEMATMIMADML